MFIKNSYNSSKMHQSITSSDIMNRAIDLLQLCSALYNQNNWYKNTTIPILVKY